MKQPNFTQVPNEIIDLMPQLSGSEFKVLVAICRKTIGWHKTHDAISLSQLHKMTGLESEACCEALKKLESMALIVVNRSPGKTNTVDLSFDTSSESEEEVFEKRSGTSSKIEDTKEREIKKEKGSTLSSDRTSPKPKPDLMYFSFTDSLWYGITDEQVTLWAEAYPACDIEMELRQMGEWCKANGSKGKKVNWRRFVVNWLKRAQDRGGSEPKGGSKDWNRQRYSR